MSSFTRSPSTLSMRSSPIRHRAVGRDTAMADMVAARAGQKWCLFLDRDGVINRQIIGDYVRTWRDFEWLPQAQCALKILAEWAPHLVVVTNQQGIGKGLMSLDDVSAIHQELRSSLAAQGTKIDGFKVCPHLESAHCDCRKPKPGLVMDTLEQYSGIDPSLSIVAGDSPSDLELARNVALRTSGCASVYIGNSSVERIADASFDSLWDFAVAVRNVREERGI